MTPTFVLLYMRQGTTFSKRVTLSNGDTPIDLSGKTARMQIRRERGGPLILELTTENGRIALDAQGRIDFLVDAATLAAIDVPRGFDYLDWEYDLEIVTPGTPAVVDRALFGTVVFWPEVTV